MINPMYWQIHNITIDMCPGYFKYPHKLRQHLSITLKYTILSVTEMVIKCGQQNSKIYLTVQILMAKHSSKLVVRLVEVKVLQYYVVWVDILVAGAFNRCTWDAGKIDVLVPSTIKHSN
jgi:hypothetical protein